MRKYTLINLLFKQNFGKYLEPQKEITRFALSKPLENI